MCDNDYVWNSTSYECINICNLNPNLPSCTIDFSLVKGAIPSLIYPLNLNAGDSIKGTCSWTVSADLDVYFYPSGTDLLVRSGYLRR